MWEPKGRVTIIWLILILGCGILIRIYAAWHLPLSNDELGTVIGSSFNFSDYFQQLVVSDGHPPGYRLFYFGWLHLVGTGNVLLIRFPALLAACFALWFWYKALDKLAGPMAALVGLAVISCSDFIAFTTILVRPYALGFLAVAVLVWALARLKLTPKTTWKQVVPVGIAWAMLMYTHYFAILTGVFLTFGWLFFLPCTVGRQVGLATLAGCVFYLPAVPLFFEQLDRGGLDWLLAPHADFAGRYVKYLFNNSYLWLIALVGGSVFGFLRSSARKRWLALHFLAIATLVFLIGYQWSIWKKPVLQYNVLVFSSLFLVGAIALGWEAVKRYRSIILIVLFGIGLWSLAVGQKFFSKDQFGDFRKQAEFIQTKTEELDEEGLTYTVFINQNNPGYLRYYLNDSIPIFSHKGYFTSSLDYISHVLDSLNPDVVISGWNGVAHPPEVEAWLLAHYPRLSDHLYQFNMGVSIYRKVAGTTVRSNLSSQNFGCNPIDLNTANVKQDSNMSIGPGDTVSIFWGGIAEKAKTSHAVAYVLLMGRNMEGVVSCTVSNSDGVVLNQQVHKIAHYPLLQDTVCLVITSVELPEDQIVQRIYWTIVNTGERAIKSRFMSIQLVCDNRFAYFKPGYWMPNLY